MNMKILFPVNQEIVNEATALTVMTEGLQYLMDIGAIKGPIDNVLLNYEFDDDGYAIAELKEGSLIDGAKLNQIGAGLYENPSSNLLDLDKVNKELKVFSTATIQERLRLAQKNPKLRLRYMIMDYKRYWKSKQSQLAKNPDQIEKLKNMFLTDMTGIMTEVLPYIQEGKQLNMLIGVSQVAPKLTSISRELSIIYKRALKSNATSGQIPKSIFSKLKTLYAQFMTELLLVVFPGIEKYLAESNDKVNDKDAIENVTKVTSRTYSSDGRIKLFNKDMKTLSNLSEKAQKYFTNRHLQWHKDNVIEKNMANFTPEVREALKKRMDLRKGENHWNQQRNFNMK